MDFWYGKYNTRHEQASFVWLAGQFDGDYKLTLGLNGKGD